MKIEDFTPGDLIRHRLSKEEAILVKRDLALDQVMLSKGIEECSYWSTDLFLVAFEPVPKGKA